MRNFTIIPNEILRPSQLSLPARYLYCVLLKYCGQNEWCYPGQITLAKDLGCSPRYIRTLLDNLYEAGIVYKKRKGFNRANNYRVSKFLEVDGNYSSRHLGSKFPLHEGSPTPPKNIYLIGKGKKSIKGFEKLGETLERKGIIGLKSKNSSPNV